MSAWAEKVESRLVALESRPMPGAHPALLQTEKRLEDQVDRLAEFWLVADLGTLVSTRTVAVATTITLSSYTAGGLVLTGLPQVPNRVNVQVPPYRIGGSDWTFVWSESTGKLLMYDNTGTELVAATDISAVANWPAVVYGSADNEVLLAIPKGALRLVELDFQVREAVAKDAADYWSAWVERRVPGVSKPEWIGARTHTNQTRLDARTPLQLYPSSVPNRGLRLDEDDELAFVAAATGTPVPLVGASVRLRFQRIVR